MIPKFLRSRVYKNLLKKAETEEIHLCRAIKKLFPFQPIYRYPELWNRRENLGGCLTPFTIHSERLQYLKEALNIITNGVHHNTNRNSK